MKHVSIVILVLFFFGFQVSARQQGPSGMPELGGSSVVVPWSEFSAMLADLRRLSSKPPAKAPRPPVQAAVSQCLASAVVDDQQEYMNVSLSFSITVLEEELWTEVPINGEDVALTSVQIDGRPATLYSKNGVFTVALRGVGRRQFKVDFLVPVEQKRGTHSAVVPIPFTPTLILDLIIPFGDASVEVDGAVLRRVESSRRTTRVQVVAGSAAQTTVRWQPKAEAEVESGPPKVFAELATATSIGEGKLRGTTTASYMIHGRGIDSFRLELPANATVLEVSPDGVRRWSTTPIEDTNRQILTVELNHVATGEFSFDFTFEIQLAGSNVTINLPDVAAVDVLHERGYIALSAATNIEITPVGPIENATPIDPSSLPEVLDPKRQAILHAFKYLRHPVVVPVRVAKHADVALIRSIVESAQIHTYASPGGNRITSALFHIKNNRKQYLELSLPFGCTLWGAYLEGTPVKAAQRDDGTFLLPLKTMGKDASGRLKMFDVEVVYFEEGHPLRTMRSEVFEAPTLDLEVMGLTWTLHLPDTRSYRLTSQDLQVAASRSVDRVRESIMSEMRDVATAVGAYAVDNNFYLQEPDKQSAQMKGLFVQAPEGTRELVSDAGESLAVLPVHLSVPREGVEMSFHGRLLRSGTATRVQVVAGPSWLKLSRGWTFVLTVVLSVGLFSLLRRNMKIVDDRRWVLPAATAIVLSGILVMTAHKSIFILSAVAVAVVFCLVEVVRIRMAAESNAEQTHSCLGGEG